jgi:DNA mismatch repair protein MutS2
LSGRKSLTLIHGHGTGALKRAIRAHLPNLSYELRFRPGSRNEGGDGVTVVELENAD